MTTENANKSQPEKAEKKETFVDVKGEFMFPSSISFIK